VFEERNSSVVSVFSVVKCLFTGAGYHVPERSNERYCGSGRTRKLCAGPIGVTVVPTIFPIVAE
jgi:hypothetical protein